MLESSFEKRMLLNAIGPNHLKSADLGFHQSNIWMHQFQSRYDILDQNNKESEFLQMLALTG